MATSRPAKALSIGDWPALGGPASTTRIPSRRRSAEGCACSAIISAKRASRSNATFSTAPSGTSSSSEKSSSASTNAEMRSKSISQTATRREKWPSTIAIAPRRCASVSANSRSAKPSASLRSMRPFSKARRVNSPGRASRKRSSCESAAKTAFTTALPPCKWSSAKSSPVRSEEHTSELQSLMRNSYAVFCLKKKKCKKQNLDNRKSFDQQLNIIDQDNQTNIHDIIQINLYTQNNSDITQE